MDADRADVEAVIDCTVAIVIRVVARLAGRCSRRRVAHRAAAVSRADRHAITLADAEATSAEGAQSETIVNGAIAVVVDAVTFLDRSGTGGDTAHRAATVDRTDRHAAALAWAETVTRVAETNVPQKDFEAARAVFEEKELVALTIAIGLMNSYNRLSVAFRAIPEAARHLKAAA